MVQELVRPYMYYIKKPNKMKDSATSNIMITLGFIGHYIEISKGKLIIYFLKEQEFIHSHWVHPIQHTSNTTHIYTG